MLVHRKNHSGQLLLWTLQGLALLLVTMSLLADMNRMCRSWERQSADRIVAWYLAEGAAIEAEAGADNTIEETPLAELGSLRTDLLRLNGRGLPPDMQTMSLRRSVVVTEGMTVVEAEVTWFEGPNQRKVTCRLPLIDATESRD